VMSDMARLSVPLTATLAHLPVALTEGSVSIG
jgi:hypothetical protein